jgi:CRP-like cAMP-binding protein
MTDRVAVADAVDPGSDGFLGRLTPAQFADLIVRGTRRTFPGGSVLAIEGDLAHEVLVLTSGRVKVSVSSAESREVVLDVSEGAALLGELSAIDGGPRSATVTALSAVEVVCIPTDSFNAFLDSAPEVMRSLLVDVVARLRLRIRHQLEFGAGDALGRVCARLLELVERQGVGGQSPVTVESPVSQANLAGWTGLSREAVVKALQSLRRLGWVENQGHVFVIRDLEQVRRRATR